MNDWLYPAWHVDYIKSYCDNIQEYEVYNETFSIPYKDATACLAIGYGFISIFMTIIIIFIIIKNRKDFEGSFYTLFIIEYSWWLVHLLHDHLVAPLFVSIWEGMPTESWFITLTYFLNQYLVFVDLFANIAISLNRLIALIFVFKYEQIWRKIFPVLMLIVFLLPLAFTWQLFPDWIAKCMLKSYAMDGQIVVIVRPTAVWRYGWMLLSEWMSIVILSSTFLNALINSISVVALFIRKSKTDGTFTVTNQKKWNVERRLFVVSFNMFMAQLLLGLIHLGFTLKFYYGNEILRFVVDYACLTPVWSLLILNKKLREKLRRFLVLKSKNQVTAWATSFTNKHES